jgi:hypothetical protein
MADLDTVQVDELTEGKIFYTMLYKTKDGDELYIGSRWMLGRTEDDALERANQSFMVTIALGLSRVKVVPVIQGYVQLTAPMQFSGAALREPLGVLLLAGPRYEDAKAELFSEIEEELTAKRKSNRDSHVDVEIIGEGELAYCRACMGGEAELWEQSCLVRQSMNLLGMDK